MLYPIQNAYRSTIDLTDFWKFRIDPADIGEREKWYEGFESDLEIAVPGSWNEQLEEAGLLHYVGSAWYCTSVTLPADLGGKSVEIRIGSADFHAKVWVNGTCLGENNLGFLPFTFSMDGVIRGGETARIVIRVNNLLSDHTIPQGISSGNYQMENRLREETNPPARFDFSPFGGIHRPVRIVVTPARRVEEIVVGTSIDGSAGRIAITVDTLGVGEGTLVVRLSGDGAAVTARSSIQAESASLDLSLESCRFWSPSDPYLYTLLVQLVSRDGVVDEYTLPVGVREIQVSGNRLLLNGTPIYLKGFGKHEDAFAIGKGLHLPLIVKDFQIMKWIGANSFRTSHYPYAEEMMFYADRKGILVIDEVPAVSLDFRYVNEETLRVHKEYLRRLVARDGNHPSIIMWALGNEPNLVGEQIYGDGAGRAYWQEIFGYARGLDPSRLLVVPNCSRAGIDDPALEFSDILCLNRYYGWYEYPGGLDRALAVLEAEMDLLHQRYQKPLFMTEFGADTIPGLHSTSDQMFTEEYQANFLEAYIRVLRSRQYVVGEHVWNFADFRTPQHFRRVVMNMKGVFTRDRLPKTAAFRLKSLWGDSCLQPCAEGGGGAHRAVETAP